MKARYATRRPYKEWLAQNTVSLADVVNTAPTAMGVPLLGVSPVSTVHPPAAAAGAAVAAKPKKAAGNGNGNGKNGKDPMQEEDALLSILQPLKAFG
jgi:hypothetical protein